MSEPTQVRKLEGRAAFRRWGARVLVGLIGVYFVYVVLTWALMSFGGLAWLTRNEKDVHVSSSGGYSLFPGYVHATNFRLAFKDYNIEMEVTADAVDASLAFWKIPFMKIHVYSVRAKGAEYRMLHRVHDAEKNRERLARFPRIAGFDRPKYYDTPKPPPSTDKQWTVKIDAIEGEARFAWILEYQLRGKMLARGSFDVDPSRFATVYPSSVEIREGKLSSGEDPVLSGLEGSVEANIETFYPPKSPFSVVIPRLSARARLGARVDSLAVTKLYFDWPVRLAGQGRLSVDTSLERGAIKKGSLGALEFERLSAVQDRAEASAHVRLALAAPAKDHFEVGVEALPGNGPKRAFESGKAQAKVGFIHGTLMDVEPENLEAHVEALGWDRPEFVRSLSRLSASVLPHSGVLDAEIKAQWPRNSPGSLDADVRGRQLHFRAGNLRLTTSFETEAHCQGDFEAAKCNTDVHLPYVVFDNTQTKDARSVWLRAHSAEPLSLGLGSGTSSGTVLIRGGDPKPVVGELIGDDWAAQLGLSFVATGAIDGRVRFASSPERVRVWVPEVRLGGTRAHGGLEAGKALKGAFVLEMAPLSVGLALSDEGVGVHALPGGTWLSSQGFGAEGG